MCGSSRRLVLPDVLVSRAMVASPTAAEHAAAPGDASDTVDAKAVLLAHMVRARLVSARMVALQRSERIGFHTSSIGEEAAIVGAALAARAEDWVFPGAREWAAALVRGMPLGTYVHHAFGSANDPAIGHASPDHAPARAFRIVPPSGVLGAHLPQAVGAAWAAKVKKERVATVALFGAEVADGGDFHNAVNFAGVFKAPVVFVCRGPAAKRISDRGVAYGIATARVDGGDAVAVHAVVREALVRTAEGKGPTLIEAVSPVLPLLSTLDDAALASGDVLDLGSADPIVRLLASGGSGPGLSAIDVAAIRAELDGAVAAAEAAGPPAPATLFDHVYAGMPAHLAAQRQKLTGG